MNQKVGYQLHITCMGSADLELAHRVRQDRRSRRGRLECMPVVLARKQPLAQRRRHCAVQEPVDRLDEKRGSRRPIALGEHVLLVGVDMDRFNFTYVCPTDTVKELLEEIDHYTFGVGNVDS